MNESRAEDRIEIPGRKLFLFSIKDTFRSITFYGTWFGISYAAYDNSLRWATWVLGLPLGIILLFDLIQFLFITVLLTISTPTIFVTSIINRDWDVTRDQAYVFGAYIVNLIEKLFFIVIIIGCGFMLF